MTVIPRAAKDTLPPIPVNKIQQQAMNHYKKLKYTSKQKVFGIDGARISPKLSRDPKKCKCDIMSSPSSAFDLNSRHLRRYIIEDVMFLKSEDRIIILIGELYRNYGDWLIISEFQKNGLEKVTIDDHVFIQIRASVIQNVKRDAYLKGTMDYDEIDYHVLGAGGAALSIAFDECATSMSIELKFSWVLMENEFQIWGNHPTKRNLYRVLYRSKTEIGKKGSLKQMFNELYGDHH